MKKVIGEYLPGVLNLLTAVFVFTLSILFDGELKITRNTAINIGMVLVGTGMGIVVYATLYIKRAILDEVEPKLNVLVKSGPYRFVRHPVYLGMTIAMLGLPISLRSWVGLASVIVLFLPSEIYRARKEEQALAKKFGEEWEVYTEHTGFMLPILKMFVQR